MVTKVRIQISEGAFFYGKKMGNKTIVICAYIQMTHLDLVDAQLLIGC